MNASTLSAKSNDGCDIAIITEATPTPVKMKKAVSCTNPDDGIEKKRDIKYVIGSIENPKKIIATNAGNISFGVHQPSSWNTYNITATKNAVDTKVSISKRIKVIQKLDTLTPLTNCSSFARDTLSWKEFH